MTPQWLIFTYKLPAEPSSKRVLVWRRLRRLGAAALHDAGWVLPRTPRTQERLQWLKAEVEEMGGEATLWEADPVPRQDAEALRARLEENLVAPYDAITERMSELAAALATDPAEDAVRECEAAYHAATREYLSLRAIDYFGSQAGARAGAALDRVGSALRRVADSRHAAESPRGQA